MTLRIFLDLDGTVYLGGKILDNVDAELRRLAEAGAIIYYMTNNTSASTREYSEKLTKLNLPLSDGVIISPTRILSSWLRLNQIGSVFAVGTEAFCSELEEASGVKITADRPDCVIVAFDREVTYEKLETACGLINSGIPWYLTHIDLACPSPVGPIPDCGAIGRLIEATTGTVPTGHFGKPGDNMIKFLESKIVAGDNVVVAGDRIYTDAEVGLKLGARTVVVCTGEFRPGNSVIDDRIEVHSTLASFLRSELP